MRKLIAITTLALVLASTLLTSITPAASTCCNCAEVKSACRIFADTQYSNCVREGTSGFICWLISEDKYQLCVTDASDGKCSIFHD